MNIKTSLDLIAYAITGDYASKPSDIGPAMLRACSQEISTIIHALNEDSHGACIPDPDELHCQLLAVARRMEATAMVSALLERGKIRIDGFDDEGTKEGEARQ